MAGLGLLTPLGHAAWPTFTALLAGRTISDRAAPLIDAEQPIDPVNLVRVLGGVSVGQHAPSDPIIDLADRAAREATFAGGVDTRHLPTYLGTSKGAVHAWTRCAERQRSMTRPRRSSGPTSSDPDDILPDDMTLLGPHGYLTRELQRRLGIAPERHVIAACASGLAALDQARTMLCRSTTNRALVLTAEAALLPQFVHSYRRLGVLAPLTPTDYRQCPLDADERRRGFMLSEASAAVLLERLPEDTPPAPGQIELCDTATAAEAHDLVRTDPQMPALESVAQRLLHHGPVDVIHPHAPGTVDHDPAELAIYRNLTAAQQRAPLSAPAPTATPVPGESASERRDRGRNAAALPDFYACKGALGHSLGASGLVSLVVACLCLHAGRRPPMPWLHAPLAGVEPGAQPCSRQGAHAVFAAGFGGHVAGALVRRH